MKTGEKLHGFTVTSTRFLPETRAEMVELTYDKNGARAIWLDRDDTNMVFGIAFKTTPEDDTGVFHILEHSVLCGSDKFPVKEPFVNLLRTSLNTFLNAMTFSDKTFYPVSSRNRRDFLNLTEVYLDAVFRPAILHKPEIFRQEGWHYEVGDDGVLTRSGVVYSEMKGAYTSVDRQIHKQLMRQLYPDTCYRFESGGAPDAIPELTYEQFVASYRKYYHPSNSYIVLDGRIPTEEVFALLDSYLKDFDRLEDLPRIADQKQVDGGDAEGLYEIGTGESTENRSRYMEGYVFGEFNDKEKALGMSIVSSVIAETNDSPLCRAVLEKELAESVSFDVDSGTRFLEAVISVKNTAPGKKEELKRVIRDTLRGLCENGLDREQLLATINTMEFSTKERDFGRTPKGLVYGMQILESWLYGGDPAEWLEMNEAFEHLRANVDTGWYEKLLAEVILDNPHRASVWLDPSAEYGEEKLAAGRKKLEELTASLGEGELDRIRAEAAALLEAQRTPDSPEALATLPVLPLSEVSETPEEFPLEVSEVLGRPVLHAPQDTSGIVYTNLFFDASDLTPEEVACSNFLCSLIGELPTKQHDSLTLQKLMKMNFGAFYTNVLPISETADRARVYFTAHMSILDSKEKEAAGFAAELLRDTVYSDAKRVGQILSQRQLRMREIIKSAGTTFASSRVSACFTPGGLANEYVSGLEQYRWLVRAGEALKNDPEDFCAGLEALAKRLISRARLTVGQIGHPSAAYSEELISAFDDTGSVTEPNAYQPFGLRREAIVIPSEISFTALGLNMEKAGVRYTGDMSVAASYLTYSYLWNTVRVQNGAYGVRMIVNENGALRFTSYRDPNAIGSLKAFREIGKVLAGSIPEEKDLNSLIIGAVGESDPLQTPHTAGETAIAGYLRRRDPEERAVIRREMLHTSGESLSAFAEKLEGLLPQCAYCVIGSRAAIESAPELFDEVISLT